MVKPKKSLGQNFVNPQVAKAAMYDIPIPVPLDVGAFDYAVSSSADVSSLPAAVSLSGTIAWASGSTQITGTSTYFQSGNQSAQSINDGSGYSSPTMSKSKYIFIFLQKCGFVISCLNKQQINLFNSDNTDFECPSDLLSIFMTGTIKFSLL